MCVCVREGVRTLGRYQVWTEVPILNMECIECGTEKVQDSQYR
jgi:Zn ribbon nucleic-acid-binding protein